MVSFGQVLYCFFIDSERLVREIDLLDALGKRAEHQTRYLLLLLMVVASAGACSDTTDVSPRKRVDDDAYFDLRVFRRAFVSKLISQNRLLARC